MYKYLKTLIFVFLIFSISFAQLQKIDDPLFISESPIYKNESGILYSDFIKFKFSEKLLDLSKDKYRVELDKINYPEVRGFFNDLKSRFGDFVINKSIKSAYWGDTLKVNKRTKEIVKVIDLSQIYQIEFSELVPVDSIIAELNMIDNIAYAEGPVMAYLTITPDDPLYSSSNKWAFDVINAEEAWEMTTGASWIVIGFSDLFHGLPNLHNELIGKVVYSDVAEFGDHGILTSGTAAALTNNNTGIASIGWNTSLMLFDSWGIRQSTADAIINMVNLGADILNFSWVSSCNYYSVRDAIEYALQNGRVCVASSGNSEWTRPSLRYPAVYNFGSTGQVFAVAATIWDGSKEEFPVDDDGNPRWNYSPGTDPIGDPTNAFIDFSAPGGPVTTLSDITTDTYITNVWGTSISAPFTSGLVALMLSVNSTLTPTEIYDILKRTTEKVGQFPYDANGWSRYHGYGRIDAANAVNVAGGAPARPTNLNAELRPWGYPWFRAYLTWSANTEPDLTGYQIYRKITQDEEIICDWTNIAFVTGTSYSDMDMPIQAGGENTLHYKIRAKDVTNQFSVYSDPALIENITVFPKPVVDRNATTLPNSYDLKNNYPNPFNPTTTISFDLPEKSFVNLTVYNIQGQTVATLINNNLEAGSYNTTFTAQNLPSGVYLYKISAGSFSQIKRMLLIK